MYKNIIKNTYYIAVDPATETGISLFKNNKLINSFALRMDDLEINFNKNKILSSRLEEFNFPKEDVLIILEKPTFFSIGKRNGFKTIEKLAKINYYWKLQASLFDYKIKEIYPIQWMSWIKKTFPNEVGKTTKETSVNVAKKVWEKDFKNHNMTDSMLIGLWYWNNNKNKILKEKINNEK